LKVYINRLQFCLKKNCHNKTTKYVYLILGFQYEKKPFERWCRRYFIFIKYLRLQQYLANSLVIWYVNNMLIITNATLFLKFKTFLTTLKFDIFVMRKKEYEYKTFTYKNTLIDWQKHIHIFEGRTRMNSLIITLIYIAFLYSSAQAFRKNNKLYIYNLVHIIISF
jgi:hypothetical protein